MKITRQEPAPDREAWGRLAREAAERLGYAVAGEGVFRRGARGAHHPDAVRHTVSLAWADGTGTWAASAAGCGPRMRAVLEARLDDLQGKGRPGSAVRVLARACAGGLAAWVLASAAMLIFAIPLCRDAQTDWAARQKMFEDRLETSRAPTAERVLASSVTQAALIPAAAFGFMVAIPLCLWLAAGELSPSLSRLNLAVLGASLLAFPVTFITPGVPWPGLLAGLAAPLAAWAGYGAVRRLDPDARTPAHGRRWLASLALLVVLAAIPATLSSTGDISSRTRDRFLYGNPAGERVATWYYTHTPLSAYAMRPPRVNPRCSVLFAGSVPRGFPVMVRKLLAVETSSKEEFLRLARGPGFTFLVYNENSGPWVVQAAEELRRTNPGRAAGFVAVTKGGLEKVFPDADPAQFVTAAVLAVSGRPEGTAVDAALDAGMDRADRRYRLRQAAHAATALVIALAPPLLLGSFLLWVIVIAGRLRARGLNRAAGAVAVAAFLLAAALGIRLARPEGELERRLRSTRDRFEALRLAGSRDPRVFRDLQTEADKVMPDLEIASRHPSRSVRVLAADALGASGQARAMEILGGSMLADPSILVRYRAAEALGRFANKQQRIRWLSNAQNDEIYVAENALESMQDYIP